MADPCGPQLTVSASRCTHIRDGVGELLRTWIRRQPPEGSFELPEEETTGMTLPSPPTPRVSEAPSRAVMFVALFHAGAQTAD